MRTSCNYLFYSICITLLILGVILTPTTTIRADDDPGLDPSGQGCPSACSVTCNGTPAPCGGKACNALATCNPAYCNCQWVGTPSWNGCEC